MKTTLSELNVLFAKGENAFDEIMFPTTIEPQVMVSPKKRRARRKTLEHLQHGLLSRLKKSSSLSCIALCDKDAKTAATSLKKKKATSRIKTVVKASTKRVSDIKCVSDIKRVSDTKRTSAAKRENAILSDSESATKRVRATKRVGESKRVKSSESKKQRSATAKALTKRYQEMMQCSPIEHLQMVNRYHQKSFHARLGSIESKMELRRARASNEEPQSTSLLSSSQTHSSSAIEN